MPVADPAACQPRRPEGQVATAGPPTVGEAGAAQATPWPQERERLHNLLNLAADWVWDLDAELRCRQVSEGWTRATGLGADHLLGRTLDDAAGLSMEPADRETLLAALARREAFRALRIGLRTPHGRPRYHCLSGMPLFGRDGEFQGYCGVGTEVTAAVEAMRQVEQRARVDALTGLPNRAQLLDGLGRALANAARHGRLVGLLYVDIDGFKGVNDRHGHAAGDLVLREVAARLSLRIRDADLLARLGGDEFVVLAEDVNGTAGLMALGHRIVQALRQPIPIGDGRRCSVSASVGIAVSGRPDAEALLKAADAAMYEAKALGKDRCTVYSAALHARVMREQSIEAELRGAIERDELELFFQPQMSLTGDALEGVEALLRWRHPVRGLILPGEFIESAERHGLIALLDEWVLDAACRQLRRWADTGLEVPRCAVNVSATHFDSGRLVDLVRSSLVRHGVAPAKLEIEVTETAVMRNAARGQALLQRLIDAGISVALDDFGVGHSSLARLKGMPATAIKLDRAFVQGLPHDTDDVAICRAVLALGQSLGLRVVAEGVETEAQGRFLRDAGCLTAQGYFYARPAPADEIARLLPAARPRARSLGCLRP